MAHYDPDGALAPHAARAAAALTEVAERVLLVSTAGLTAAARAAVPPGVELVERENSGYDFGSWRAGLDRLGLLRTDPLGTSPLGTGPLGTGGGGSPPEVVLTNDSCIGPLVPWSRVFDGMAGRPGDFWGMTRTLRRGLHVQSFFLVFRPWVVGAPSFRRFWTDLVAVSDRRQVIARHEVGLSVALQDAGFASDSWFRETPADQRLARERTVWWALHAARLRPRGKRLAALRRMPREPWNPMAALADRALDGDRLPLVKLDTLRYDPYRLGSARLLAACEAAHPAAFDGVRDHLARTGGAYVLRPDEPGSLTGATPPAVRLVPGLGYAT